jgi:hypothetical protein
MDFGALRDRSSHDPIVARDFESLCLFFNRDKEGYSAKRMPISFQADGATKAISGNPMLQNLARGCSYSCKKLAARR